MVVLSFHLQGIALYVYSRLSADEAEKYDVMDRFEYMEEVFKIKFRTCSQRGEKVSQFVTRLKNLLARWMKLSSVKKSLKV